MNILEARILIVDDDPGVVRFIQRALSQSGYTNLRATTKAREALALCHDFCPDLMILDLHMPELSGFDILEKTQNEQVAFEPIPVLVLTGETGREARMRALEMGARDYIVKPFDLEALARVRNMLERRLMGKKLFHQNIDLEEQVRLRTRALKKAQVETVRRLGVAAEYRDDDTGEHVIRIYEYTRAMALGLGYTERKSERIGLAAKLHDIGKLGIPDAILLKPGKLTVEEFEVMKTHTVIGAKILSGAQSKLLRAAEVIALNHHEKWDGSGYPNGRAGNDIPKFARLVAVVDVFDALTSARPYKSAWPVERAMDYLRDASGSHFDPDLVSLFFSQWGSMSAIREQAGRMETN